MLHHCGTVIDYVVVVLEHKAAFEYVVLSERVEALVRDDQAEPFLGNSELTAVVGDIAELVTGRSGKAAFGSGFHFEKITYGLVIAAGNESAIAATEVVVQLVGGRKPGLGNLLQHGCGPLIILFHEEAGGIFITDTVAQHRFGILLVVFQEKPCMVIVVGLDGAEHCIGTGHRVPERLEYASGLAIRAVLIEIHGILIRVRRLLRARAHRRRKKETPGRRKNQQSIVFHIRYISNLQI